MRRGHQVADEAVISALLARATGIEQRMTKAFCHGGQPGTASYIVQLPRDGRACIFWLRSRRPEEWRENCPFADEKDDEEWVSELEAASERARLASLPAASAKDAWPETAPACWRRAAPRCPTFRCNGRPPLRWKVKLALIGVALAETAETPAA